MRPFSMDLNPFCSGDPAITADLTETPLTAALLTNGHFPKSSSFTEEHRNA